MTDRYASSVLFLSALAAVPGCASPEDRDRRPIDHRDVTITESPASALSETTRLWPRVMEQQQHIRAALANYDGHEWAGSYSYGAGTSGRFDVSPDGSFVYGQYGCMGLGEANFGRVIEVHHDRLGLDLEFRPALPDFCDIAPTMHRVRWGDRHYLIPRSHMIRFCNAVNSGAEPGLGGLQDSPFFFLRDQDVKKPVYGTPSVPEEFGRFLLSAPLTARITRVLKDMVEEGSDPEFCARRYIVEIDTGREHRLLPGMTLHEHERDRSSGCWITVLSVMTTRSVVEIYDLMSCREEYAQAPRIGDVLSTRDRFYDDRREAFAPLERATNN